MRFPLMVESNGRRAINWAGLLMLVLSTQGLVIGFVELCWYLVAGGFSPVLGWFAFVLAWLIVIRFVGEAITETTLYIEGPSESL